jgi:hypothetical protein
LKKEAAKLLGRWTTDPKDKNSLKNFGRASLIFKEHDLTYIIHSKDKDEIILLKYKIKNNFLITTQPSIPKEEITYFYLPNPTTLVLEYQGIKSQYIKDLTGH